MTMHNITATAGNIWSSSTYGSGWTCARCGWWVPAGTTHGCTPGHAWTNSWTCGICNQVVSGFHICPGPRTFLPIAAPEKRPESPLAALVADLRALLAKGQEWLESRKL